MPLLSTESIVLHAFAYSETSRILRLATREAGVVSVLARGARRSKSRFGSALDLFAQGTAHLSLREGRDLQTLSGFDVSQSRPTIAEDLGRFAGASVLAELVLRFGTDDVQPHLFDELAEALDGIAVADPLAASASSLAAAWRLVGTLGFAPSLAACSACHALLAADADCAFSHTAGGALCATCARQHSAPRTIPAAARARIAAWSAERPAAQRPLEQRETRAHQRLLREFLVEHLSEGRSLRAFDAWEHGGWSSA